MALSKIDVANMVTGATPVANGGTALTSGFVNGITMVDQWRITSTYADQEDDGFVFTSNWERVDTDSDGVPIGTGMSESSGIFTFPSTGIYLIEARMVIYDDRSHAVCILDLETTTDNSSYGDAAQGRTFLENGGSTSYNVFSSAVCSHVFDVTNVTTHKVRMVGRTQSNETADSLNYQGDTNLNYTSIKFTRLGDT
jgi:hypothetical protein